MNTADTDIASYRVCFRLKLQAYNIMYAMYLCSLILKNAFFAEIYTLCRSN